MPQLSKWSQNLKPGLRKLLNYLNCLSPPPDASGVGGGVQVLRPPATTGREGIDMPASDAPGTHAETVPTPSSATRPDPAPSAAPPQDVAGGAGASAESAGPQVQVRDEQSPLDADALAAVKDGVRAAETAHAGAGHIGERPSDALQHVADGAAGIDEWSERVNGLFDKISVFSKLVSGIGEVHPYAKIAATLIQAALKPILAQKARDDAMKELINDMAHAYDVVMAHYHQFEGVKDDKDDPHCKLLARLAQQTGECATFIREHYDDKSFLKRAWKATLKFNLDDMIAEYSKAFVKLGRMITDHDIPRIIDLVRTVSITESRIEATLTLQELQYAEGTGRQRDKACLPGTRTATLDNLVDWINDPDATRTRFVVGVAGSGKTSIAHTVASRLETFGRLGAFFAFDRTNKSLAPWSLFSTLARELADWNADFRRELSAVLSESGRLAKSGDVIEQWENLIVRPAQKAHWVGPVLVVVDAFDECTDLTEPPAAFDRTGPNLLRERENLLKALTKRAADLPANFRVLVTSRLESDVDTALRNHSSTSAGKTTPDTFDYIDLGLKEHDPTESISVYIRHEMERHLDNKQIHTLVVAADGLFEWAATVCRLLNPKTGGLTVAERYKKWLAAPSAFGTVGFGQLEALYAKILSQQFPDDTGIDRFRSVMAQVLYSAELLSMDTLRGLRRGVDASDGAVDLTIPHLGSLLSGVGDSSEPIRPLHTSFRDFLTRADPPHAWRVEPGDVHDVIALGALRALNKSLHFNIWDFPSSDTSNCEIRNLDNRMKKLPAGLVYASWHWSYHLAMALNSGVSLQTELRIFLVRKLLFWLEVASLCGFMHRAVQSLLTAASFSKQLHDVCLIKFITDAVTFVREFIEPIRSTVPHIYLSALTFCPTMSWVRRSFACNNSLLPTVDGLAAEWPVVLCPHRVLCFAYTPDGRHMVLGSMDGEVHVVDAENMHERVLELARAPGDPFLAVCSVAVSPNSQVIAAAVDFAIFRWNARTGELLDTLLGHTGQVRSVCFSPDGRYLVSASDDKTVRRWDVNSGKQIGHALRGHTKRVTSVVCTLDSRSIISASEDATIRIWRTESGQQDGSYIPCSRGEEIWALSRSPKCNLIAIGTEYIRDSVNSELTVFDFGNRSFVRKPLSGRGADIWHTAWSPDGRYIASVSADRTVRLWDYFGSSYMVLYSHTQTVNTVEFSPDGKRILLVDVIGALRTVDIAAAQSQSSAHHAIPAEHAAYSPDGRFVAVIFHGQELPYVWDSETGGALSDQSVLTASLIWLKPAMEAPSKHYDFYSDWKVRKEHRPHDIASANGLRSAGVWDDKISIWDSASQTLLEPSIRILTGSVTCVALSPSGDYVLQGSSDGTVRIFHVAQTAADHIPGLPCTSEENAIVRRRTGHFLDEGWLMCNHDPTNYFGDQIIFIPEHYHTHLWVPGLRHILRPNRAPATPVKIDFSGVGLGTEWTRCGGALSVDLGNAPVSSEPLASENLND